MAHLLARIGVGCAIGAILSACGSTSPPGQAGSPDVSTPAAAVDSGPPPETAEPTPAALATSLERPAWRWQGPDPMDAGGWRRGPVEVGAEAGRRCRFVVDEAAGTSSLACLDAAGRELWHRLRRGAASHDDAALLVAGDRLVVARHSAIASGARLSCFELETGLELWTAGVWGLGPIGHSQYRNEVELAADGARVVVFGWEAAGRYVEVRTRDGAWLGTFRSGPEGGEWTAAPPPEDDLGLPPREAPPLGAAAGLSWWWPTAGEPLRSETLQRSEVETEAGGRCRSARSLGGRASLECRDAAGLLLWGDSLGADSPAALLVAAGRTLLEVHYHPGTTGASVRGRDLATGRLLYVRHLYAMGPISHSRWRSEVRARAAGGRLEVYGAESAGRYVEVLDLGTGRVLGYRAWPRP